MKASIITPTFNAASYLRGCIENVQQQGAGVLEHVIADGGSTDGTLDIIAELQRIHPNVRLVPGPDRGQSDAMNKATAAARAPVIGVLNADDYYEPGAVASALALFEARPGLDLVVGDVKVVDEHDALVRWNRPTDLRPAILLKRDPQCEVPANPAGYFYTKALHDRIGGYDVDDHYTMDIAFLMRALSGGRFLHVNEHWGNFRFLPGTKSFGNVAADDPLGRVLAAHYATYSPLQKARAAAIWQGRRMRVRAWKLLRRLGLK